MKALTPELNSNLVFWTCLVSSETRSLLLLSQNEALVQQVMAFYHHCVVVYTGSIPDRLADRVIPLSNIPSISAKRFDTVMVDNVLPAQWPAISSCIEQQRANNKDMAVVITGRNRLYDLLHLRPDPRSMRIGRILSDLKYLDRESVSIFYARWHLTLDDQDEVDLTPATKAHRNVYVPGSRLRTLKSYLLSRPLINRFLPGWVLTNCPPGESLIEKTFATAMIARAAASDRFEIERFITGNASTAIAILRQPGTMEGYVARLPSTRLGNQLCRRNAQTLRRISEYGFSFKTPILLVSDEQDNAIHVETLVQGKEVSVGRNQPADITRKVLAVAGEISNANRAEIAWDTLIDQRTEFYKATLHAEYLDQLDRLCELLKFNVAANPRSFTVASHGDFKLGNILFRPDLSIEGVIDWDCFDESGLPLFDELTYLVYLYSLIYGLRHFESYSDRLLTLKQVDDHLELVSNRAGEYGLSRQEYLNYRILFWFDHIIRRYNEVNLEIPVYRKVLVGNPLQQCIEALEAEIDGSA